MGGRRKGELGVEATGVTDALLWIVLAGGLLVGEVFTLAAVAGLLAGGALAAFAATFATHNVAAQLAVFAVVSTALLVVVRPVAVRQLHTAVPSLPGGPGGLVGTVATVVQDVAADSGQVRVNGELWRARPEIDTDEIPVGARVFVQSVHGATLHVLSADLDHPRRGLP